MSAPQVAAVILAAGFGTRLAPLTDETPKPLLEVGGAPVVSRLVERLGELDGLAQVVVVVNEQHPQQWANWHAALDVTADVIVVSNGVRGEADRVGAVADLATAVAAISARRYATHDRIVVLAGDNLIDEPLQPHVDASRTRGLPIVLCRNLGADVPAGRFGEITIDDNGVITRFREKPADPQSPLAATCTYVLPADVDVALAEYLLVGDADSPGSFVSWLANQGPVLARPLTDRYFDIGNHATLAAARQAYAGESRQGNTD